MLEMVSREYREQFLGSADAEGGYENCSASLDDFRYLFDKLLFQTIANRVVFRSVRPLDDDRVQILVVTGICAVDQPCWLTIEIASIQQPFPLRINYRLSATWYVASID